MDSNTDGASHLPFTFHHQLVPHREVFFQVWGIQKVVEILMKDSCDNSQVWMVGVPIYRFVIQGFSFDFCDGFLYSSHCCCFLFVLASILGVFLIVPSAKVRWMISFLILCLMNFRFAKYFCLSVVVSMVEWGVWMSHMVISDGNVWCWLETGFYPISGKISSFFHNVHPSKSWLIPLAVLSLHLKQNLFVHNQTACMSKTS